MHAGSRIVQLSRSGDEWEFAVLAKFEEHKSMNYGSDVQPLTAGAGGGDVEGGEQQAKRVIVSTSFYDKLMCVWSFWRGAGRREILRGVGREMRGEEVFQGRQWDQWRG
jgi:hypothetical protein